MHFFSPDTLTIRATRWLPFPLKASGSVSLCDRQLKSSCHKCYYSSLHVTSCVLCRRSKSGLLHINGPRLLACIPFQTVHYHPSLGPEEVYLLRREVLSRNILLYLMVIYLICLISAIYVREFYMRDFTSYCTQKKIMLVLLKSSRLSRRHVRLNARPTQQPYEHFGFSTFDLVVLHPIVAFYLPSTCEWFHCWELFMQFFYDSGRISSDFFLLRLGCLRLKKMQNYLCDWGGALGGSAAAWWLRVLEWYPERHMWAGKNCGKGSDECITVVLSLCIFGFLDRDPVYGNVKMDALSTGVFVLILFFAVPLAGAPAE